MRDEQTQIEPVAKNGNGGYTYTRFKWIFYFREIEYPCIKATEEWSQDLEEDGFKPSVDLTIQILKKDMPGFRITAGSGWVEAGDEEAFGQPIDAGSTGLNHPWLGEKGWIRGKEYRIEGVREDPYQTGYYVDLNHTREVPNAKYPGGIGDWIIGQPPDGGPIVT